METVAVVLEQPGKLALRTVALQDPGADDLVVDAVWSGISSGTERLLWAGRMGYSGATYLIQEVCNALFDALFNILPLAADLDRVDPTPTRLHEEILWSDEAKALLDEVLEAHPVLVRISAAKRLRDAAESGARRAGEDLVTTEIVARARAALMDGQPACRNPLPFAVPGLVGSGHVHPG